jgi:hypothetical protein
LKSSLDKLPVLLIATGIFFASAGHAESSEQNRQSIHPAVGQKWRIWLGGFFPNMDSSVRLDSEMGNPGDGLDLEDTLGLNDKKSTLWGGANWRISRRNQIEIEINNLKRSGSNFKTLEDYQIGDYIIEADGEIETLFNVTLARVTYGFSMIRTDRHDLSIKGGFHLTRVEAALGLKGDVTDIDTGDSLCTPTPCEASVIEKSDFAFPLPHVGLAYGFAITPKLAFRAQALGFYIEISDIKGTLTELDLDLQYQPWKHFGFGAGFRYFNVTVDDKSDEIFRGRFDYEYYGPVIYVLGSF